MNSLLKAVGLGAALLIAGGVQADAGSKHHAKAKHAHHAKHKHTEHPLDWLFAEPAPKHAHAKHKGARAAHIKKHAKKSS